MAGVYNEYFMQLLAREGIKIDATKVDEAIEQIHAYIEDKRLPQGDMKKFIVVYVGQKLELLEEV